MEVGCERILNYRLAQATTLRLEEGNNGASLSTGSHTDLREHQPTEGDAASLGEAESALSDAL